MWCWENWMSHKLLASNMGGNEQPLKLWVFCRVHCTNDSQHQRINGGILVEGENYIWTQEVQSNSTQEIAKSISSWFLLTKYPCDQTKDGEMIWACYIHWTQEKCMQGFGGEGWRKETTWKIRRRWEDDITMDLKEIAWNGVGWIHLAQDRVSWQNAVNTVVNFLI
jgi:hypothetical protein